MTSPAEHITVPEYEPKSSGGLYYEVNDSGNNREKNCSACTTLKLLQAHDGYQRKYTDFCDRSMYSNGSRPNASKIRKEILGNRRLPTTAAWKFISTVDKNIKNTTVYDELIADLKKDEQRKKVRVGVCFRFDDEKKKVKNRGHCAIMIVRRNGKQDFVPEYRTINKMSKVVPLSLPKEFLPKSG